MLILTTFEATRTSCGRCGPGRSGFLSKGVEPTDLPDAIGVVAAGEALLPPKATHSLIARFLDQPEPDATRPTPAQLDGLIDR